MKIIRYYGSRLAIIVCASIFIGYKYIFVRDDQNQQSSENKIGKYINDVPYTVYFDMQQQQPSVFFTAPAFPAYTKRCHENKKLCSVLPTQQIYADMQWLGSIQFVGGQANPNELLGLSKLLDNLSNLAPYWNYPYVFGQLLVPIAKAIALHTDKATVQESRENAKILAEKGEYYTCDPVKVAGIAGLDEHSFIDTVYDPTLKQTYLNPCPTYERAHYAAFNAFYFRKKPDEAARNYRISAFTEGSPGLAPVMAALVYGRGGEHIKSATIWYDRYITLLQGEQNDITIGQADSTLRKAVFELQLQFITDADNNTNKTCKQSYDCLQKNGSIKDTITNSYNTICEKGTNSQNIRCILLYTGLKNKRISLQGSLVYPGGEGYVFARSDQYDSRWLRPIN